MFWIFALGIVTLAVAHKGFRKFLRVAAVLIVLAIGGVVLEQRLDEHQKAEAVRLEEARLPPCPKEIYEAKDDIYRDLDARAAQCRL